MTLLPLNVQIILLTFLVITFFLTLVWLLVSQKNR